MACAGDGEAPADAPARAAGPVQNVVLVTIDTLRADALGFMGNQEVETPLLDRLAAGGRVFTFAHSHYPMTTPSHASILSGLYPYQHGVRDNGGFVLGADVPTAASLLRDAGFTTGAVVAAYPLDAEFGLARGFDTYDDHYPELKKDTTFSLPQRRGDEVVGLALDWWRAHAGERRFLWVHLFDPHRPYEPPEPFASRYRANPYLGEVAATDHFLTPLLGPLLDGADPGTLVVVMADHGEGLGDHGEMTHGVFAYQTTLHVPLVVWGGGAKPGRDDRLARHVDVLPTILAAARVAAPDGLPGRSLLGPPPPPGETSYFESLAATLNRGWAPLRGLIEDRRKIIHLPLVELYDLAADPAEERNLVDDERREARRLLAALPEESQWPPERGEVREEATELLRSLGYLSGNAEIKEAYTPADDPKNLIEIDHQLHQVVELHGAGRLSEAAEILRRVAAERPDMPLVWSYLAQVLLDAGRTGEAIAVMREAAARDAASETLLTQLAGTLTFVGRPDEAVEVLRPLAEGGSPAVLNPLGLALVEMGRPAEAVPVLERSLARDPDNVRAHENLGLAALALGRWPEARQRLERALALDPELATSWNGLGVALYYLGERPGALDAWERAIDLDPRQFDALYNLGLKAIEAGERSRARAALERFAATAPPERYAADIARARDLLSQLR